MAPARRRRRQRPVPALSVLLAPLLAGRTAPAQPEGPPAGGHWLPRHFVEKMDCKYDRAEVEFWDDVFATLAQRPAAAAGADLRARLAVLAALLRDVLLPFGTADPVAALACPVGVSALFRETAEVCINVFGEGCLQRALRLLHLAKLFLFVVFNDFGAWFSLSRWGVELNELSKAAQELVPLARAAGGMGREPVGEDLAYSPRRWRIGLVTYCNYNDTYTRLTSLSRDSKHAYAGLHKYALLHYETPFVSQAHPWMNKLIAIQRNLAEFDWLFWVDCDLFFMNPRRSVEALVEAAVGQNPDASLVIAEDGMMLNSGAFLLRNSPWGRDFLGRTGDLLSAPSPHSFQHMPWHEQAPLIYLSLVPSVLEGLGRGEASGEASGRAASLARGLSAGYDPQVVLLPQRALNSYPPEVVQKTGHALSHETWKEGDLVISSDGCASLLGGEPCEVVQKTGHALPHEAWEEGDFVISFNGCASLLGGEPCEAMYARYHAMSMDRFRYP